MNNYSLSDIVQEIEGRVPQLRNREGELVKIVEAIRKVRETAEWSTLKTYIFDGVLESLESKLKAESHRAEIDSKEIYKLQGQIAWAKKYSNLDTLASAFTLELTNVRLQLNPPTERL